MSTTWGTLGMIRCRSSGGSLLRYSVPHTSLCSGEGRERGEEGEEGEREGGRKGGREGRKEGREGERERGRDGGRRREGERSG